MNDQGLSRAHHRRIAGLFLRLGVVPLVVAMVVVAAWSWWSGSPAHAADGDVTGERARPLMVMTGPGSSIDEERFVLARTQKGFDEEWVEHMGDRVTRAAQGWPMSPRVDFEACRPVFLFGGSATNTNGYRVVEVVRASGVTRVRYEDISFQTASLDGSDAGVSARPWALVLLPAGDGSIVLEKNVQSVIGNEPIWREQARLE